jgi:hypothetical protein
LVTLRPVELVKRSGVPIVRTGTYQLSTGPWEFTRAQLAAAVDAWANDPGVLNPRIKLGHIDPRDGFDGLGQDGQPALGYADNLRLADGGDEIVADFHVPGLLADMMDWAYPARSIEGVPDFESGTGQTHDLVLTAVALLGEYLPAVLTLDDLYELPDQLADIAANHPDAPIAATLLPEFLVGPSSYRRSVQVRPDEAVAFEGAVKTYVAAARAARPIIEEDSMTDAQRRALASHLGLASDATEDQINAALAKAESLPPEVDPAEKSAPATSDEPVGAPPPTTDVPSPAAPVVPESDPAPAEGGDSEGRAVLVSASRRQELEAAAALGVQARNEQIRAARDRIVEDAIAAGRIMPSERADWRRDLDEAPAQTERILGRLAAGRHPVGGPIGTQEQDTSRMAEEEAAQRAVLATMGVPGYIKA